jgi:hypothetical protein
MQLTSLIITLAMAISAATLNADERGRFAKWAKIELTFTGHESRGRGEVNPFAVKFDETFCRCSKFRS